MVTLNNLLKTSHLVFIFSACIYSPFVHAANEEVQLFPTMLECQTVANARSNTMYPSENDIPIIDPCSVTAAHPSGTKFHPSQRKTKNYACKEILTGYMLYVLDYHIYDYKLAEKKVYKLGGLESCYSAPYLAARTLIFNTYCSATRRLSQSTTTTESQFSFSVTGAENYVPALELIKNYSMPTSSNCNNTQTGTVGPSPSPLAIDQVKQPWIDIRHTGPGA